MSDPLEGVAGLLGTAVGLGITVKAADMLFDEIDEFDRKHGTRCKRKRARDDFF